MRRTGGKLEIRATRSSDIETVLEVHRRAFGSEDEPELTRILLEDAGAAPLISLVAEEDGRVVGHILLSSTSLEGTAGEASMMVAPLGVIPDRQKNGIGTALTRAAIEQARQFGIDLLFLAGHPGYYPRFGFRTRAQDLGFAPPAPMPPDHAEAWMVLELTPGAIQRASGRVVPAEELSNPKYWME